MQTKKYLSIILPGIMALLAFTAKAQTSIDYIMKLRPEMINEVFIAPANLGQCKIEMPFNSASISDTSLFSQFHNQRILRIDLVYTTFHLGEEFRQPELNFLRLKALKKFAPELFENSAIEWHVLAQTKGKNVAEASKMFHGFIITYSKWSASTLTEELSLINEALSPDRISKIAGYTGDTSGTYPSGCFSQTVGIQIDLKKKMVLNIDLPVRSNITKTVMNMYSKQGYRAKTKKIDSTVILKADKSYNYYSDSLMATGRRYDPVSMVYTHKPGDYAYLNTIDSTVFMALERNKNWQNMIVVEDVTGSMGPYTAQLLVWNRLTYLTRKTRNFVFFNDGDNTPDALKIIGLTGGIYHVFASKLSDVERGAQTAMKHGGGGDAPENNMEATLHAINKCPDCELVMIADNFANVKDIPLLALVKKPVHIILCGSLYSINTQYLDIARATRGSVSTMEEDLNDLMNLSEGETITIGTRQFTIKNGKFAAY